MNAPVELIDNRVALGADVAYRELDNTFYVYSLCTGETSQLGGIGARIWNGLAEGQPLHQIAGALSRQFSVPLAQAEQDVREFVQTLYGRGLISIDGRICTAHRSPAQANRWQPALSIDAVTSQRIPFRIDFELTYACNLACAYCYTLKDNHHLLNTRQVQSILDQLTEAGTLFLCFTGGEPFARQDTESIIAYAQERKFALLVLTNATLITPARAALLARTSMVQVSLHGACAATHDTFTGVGGSFEKACRGIRYLTEAGAKVYVIFNATRHNIREEDVVRRLCEEWQVGFSLNVHLLPNVNGSLAPLQYRVSDDDVRNLARQGKLVRSRSICTGGITKARISPFGDVYPCELLRRSFGNLCARTFKEIWRSAELEAFRDSEFFAVPDTCQVCKWQMFCRRCPALAEMEDRNAYGPSSEACRVARLITEARGEGRIPRHSPLRKEASGSSEKD